MNTISSSEFENFEQCLDACAECPVVIERDGAPKAVLVSFEAYEYFMELETGILQLLAEMEEETKPAKKTKTKKTAPKKKIAAKKTVKKAAKKSAKKVTKKAAKKKKR